MANQKRVHGLSLGDDSRKEMLESTDESDFCRCDPNTAKRMVALDRGWRFGPDSRGVQEAPLGLWRRGARG